MTKIKMCGLRREVDIEYANVIKPEYIGYVFAKSSKRYVQPETAAELIDSGKALATMDKFIAESNN